MRRLFFLCASITALATTSALAQSADAGGTLRLELNRTTDIDGPGCQLVFFGQNGLDTGIEEVTWRLAVMDADGVFKALLALPLGKLNAGKRRIASFNLASTTCAGISEIIVNDAAVCDLGSGGDQDLDVCLTNLEVSSRTDIAFGL